MTTAVTVLVAAGGTLVLLTTLFVLEERRNTRLFGGVRSFFDRCIASMRTWLIAGLWRQRFLAVRWFGYRGVHVVLTRCLQFVRLVTAYLEAVMKRNKAKAKTLQAEGEQTEYFRSLQLHKSEHSLSERERQRLKRFH